jgi:hypothetical protein
VIIWPSREGEGREKRWKREEEEGRVYLIQPLQFNTIGDNLTFRREGEGSWKREEGEGRRGGRRGRGGKGKGGRREGERRGPTSSDHLSSIPLVIIWPSTIKRL